MKHKRFFFFSILLGWTILFSCSPTGSKNAGTDNGWYLEIVDSLIVDYVGTLYLHDYDIDRKTYLMEDFQKGVIFLIGKSGEVLTQFSLNTDGPNAIRSPLSFGFYNGEITIMDAQKGFLIFSDTGEITGRIEIPQPYFYVNMLRTPLYSLGNELAYIRPERGELDLNNQSEMFRGIYRSPLLEVFDPGSGTVRNTMDFPPHTKYGSGQFFHWIFPHILQQGEDWLLYMLAELKYHVYRKEGEEIVFQQTVDLGIEDAIPMHGVPLDQIEKMYEEGRYNVFGKIEIMYALENKRLVLYTKGVEEEVAKQYGHANRARWESFIKGIDRYLAIFDNNHQSLQKDIPIPNGLILTKVVNNEKEILALKDQDYFGVEESHVTFYKLKLRK